MKHAVSLTATGMLAMLLAHSPPSNAAEVSMKPYSSPGGAVTVYTTAQGAEQRMARSEAAALKPGHKLTEVENSIFVNPDKHF